MACHFAREILVNVIRTTTDRQTDLSAGDTLTFPITTTTIGWGQRRRWRWRHSCWLAKMSPSFSRHYPTQVHDFSPSTQVPLSSPSMPRLHPSPPSLVAYDPHPHRTLVAYTVVPGARERGRTRRSWRASTAASDLHFTHTTPTFPRAPKTQNTNSLRYH